MGNERKGGNPALPQNKKNYTPLRQNAVPVKTAPAKPERE
jgi:hypothetical protein